MKLVLNKNIQTIFLSKNSDYKIEDNYNIILSPEFYWMRVFDIPSNSNTQIKKLLPSLFEDILPSDDFEYFFIKLQDNKYTCFAYNSSEIISYLKKKNLNANKLNNIYFAQTELLELSPFKFKDDAYIQKDSSLIKVPLKFIGDKLEELNLDDIKLSKNKIKLNIHQNILNTKNTYILAVLFLLISIFNFITISSINSDIEKFEENKIKIKQKEKLPATSLQLNSLSKSLAKIDKKQKNLRQAVKRVFELKKSYKNIKIKGLQYNSKKLFLSIENISLARLKTALKTYKIKELSNTNNILKVELSL